MAKCLRCGAGNEWLQGEVKPEPDAAPAVSPPAGERDVEAEAAMHKTLDDMDAMRDLRDDLEQSNRELEYWKRQARSAQGPEDARHAKVLLAAQTGYVAPYVGSQTLEDALAWLRRRAGESS